MNNIQEAILQTLSYHAKYSFPLTLPELHRYLITAVPISRSRVELELQKLLKAKKVKQANGFFCPTPPNSPNSLNTLDFSALRLRRQLYSAPKLQIARRAARLLSFLPAIQLICITGSLAMQNSDQNDDIDLMIVTSANSLWLTRPLIVLLVSLFFHRRLPSNLPKFPKHPKFPNEVCLNLWLDEFTLTMPLSRQNLRVAHELAQMKPILNKKQTYEKMLSANSWLKTCLANFRLCRIPQIPQISLNPLIPLIPLNWLFYLLQLLYMFPRRTTEKIGLHFAFFHPNLPKLPKSSKLPN